MKPNYRLERARWSGPMAQISLQNSFAKGFGWWPNSWSDRGGCVFSEPSRGESMIAINQLQLVAMQSRVAQPHR